MSVTESTISGAHTGEQTTLAIHSTFKHQSSPTDYSATSLVTKSTTTGETTQSYVVTTGETTQSNLVTTGETIQSNLVTTGETTQSNLVTTGETTQSNLVTTGETTQSNLVTTGETTQSNLVTTGETTQSNLVTTGETTQSNLVTTGETTQSNLVTTGETTLSSQLISGETTHSHLVTTASTERFPSTTRQAINALSSSLDNTTNVDCICTCSFQLNLDDPNDLAKHVLKLESLRKELHVEKKSLSNAKRRLISAPDERPSSKYIGAFGIFVLLIIGMVIVLPDFIKLCTWLQDRVWN